MQQLTDVFMTWALTWALRRHACWYMVNRRHSSKGPVASDCRCPVIVRKPRAAVSTKWSSKHTCPKTPEFIDSWLTNNRLIQWRCEISHRKNRNQRDQNQTKNHTLSRRFFFVLSHLCWLLFDQGGMVQISSGMPKNQVGSFGGDPKPSKRNLTRDMRVTYRQPKSQWKGHYNTPCAPVRKTKWFR